MVRQVDYVVRRFAAALVPVLDKTTGMIAGPISFRNRKYTLTSNEGTLTLTSPTAKVQLGQVSEVREDTTLLREGLSGLIIITSKQSKVKKILSLPWHQDPSLDIKLNLPRFNIDKQSLSQISLDRRIFTEAVLKELLREYPSLRYSNNNKHVILDTTDISEDELKNLVIDLQVFSQNPEMAKDNICCHLDNYAPITPSQKEMLKSARQLLNYKGLRSSGLFLQGDTGVGKTHISLALAKEFVKTGKKVLLVEAESYTLNRKTIDQAIAQADVVIVDDFNTGFEHGDMYKTSLSHVAKNGGIIFITSNSSYEKVVFDESFVTDKDKIARFRKYGEDILKLHHITGPSQRLTGAWYTDLSLSSERKVAYWDIDRDEYRTCNLDSALFTDEVIAELKEYYSDLAIEKIANRLTINTTLLSDEALSNLITDISFFMGNSNIAIENICCSLENFDPKNESQIEMLDSAFRLLNYEGTRPAGLYLQGDAGVGKTHISIALAKEFMKRGKKVRFLPATTPEFPPIDFQGAEVVIFDDFNSGFSRGRTFKQAVNHVHKMGGRLFITSNHPYEKTVYRETFGAHSPELAGYDDRTKGLLLFHTITGDSQRQEDAWYADETLSSEIELKTVGYDRTVYSKIKLDPKIFNLQALSELQRNFPNLESNTSSNKIVLITNRLSDEELSDLIADINFYKNNSHIPIENICCRLNNYEPEDISQTEMLNSAGRLLNYTGSKPAGLFLEGAVGAGKTHIAIGVAKELEKKGHKVLFISDYSSGNIKGKIKDYDVIILDNYNSGYAKGDIYQEAVRHVHQNGGRLFITSTSDFEKVVIGESFVGTNSEIPRFLDRTKSLFLFCELQGESYRLKNTWHHGEKITESVGFNREGRAKSEEVLLTSLAKLISYDGSKPAGLFIQEYYADKNKLFRVLEEECASRGQKVQIIDAANVGYSDTGYLPGKFYGDVIILNDLSDSSCSGHDLYRHAVDYAHRTGAKLVVFSGMPFDKLVEKSFVTHRDEMPRHVDRANEMFFFHKFEMLW